MDLSVVGQDATAPEVAVNSSGNVTAVWSRSNGTKDIIQTAMLPTPTTRLALSVRTPSVSVGGALAIRLTLSTRNTGRAAARSVRLCLTLPAGTVFVTTPPGTILLGASACVPITTLAPRQVASRAFALRGRGVKTIRRVVLTSARAIGLPTTTQFTPVLSIPGRPWPRPRAPRSGG